ncbi:hypothetical protein DFH08DRAFT_964101 [Mycena albidolilacea]|uniref:Uncharacterized protein n=1 Tax=Mycena albidolilacea TaxID=1033008 RepID=A0AAD7ELY4_9AGAR|nr:hypothetical protein DFH08DRAFT_964101 [Mycena albidolilacea]
MAASPLIEEDLETLLTAIKNLPASAQSGRRSVKYMGYVAWDTLAIPGVGISVEKQSVDIITKEWLKSGLAEGVNYTDFIKVHEK